MIILKAKQVSKKLRVDPFTETVIEQAYGIAYIPFIEADESGGVYTRAAHRVKGYVVAFDDYIVEKMFAVTDGIDLIVRYYTLAGSARKRTFLDVLFVGKPIGTEGLLREQGRVVPPAILFAVPFVV